MVLMMTPTRVPVMDQMLNCAKPQVMVSATDPAMDQEFVVSFTTPSLMVLATCWNHDPEMVLDLATVKDWMLDW